MALSLVQKLAHQVRVPASGDFNGDRIYKDECVFSFDNPESEGGLYVCLNTFLGFGRKFVERHFQKTGNGLYLHLKTIKHKIPVEKTAQDEAKVTRLAIGLEGGFSGHGNSKYEYEETNSLAILPEFLMIPLPNPDLPEHVQVAIGMILAADSASKLEEALALTGTWDGEKRKISKHANCLRQDNNGIKIPPRGWKCELCDKTENLWLNLTDGSILCGRRFFDGTGGNNHALEHFQRNGFPLAVKLGTITPVGADVFSYEEDEMVEDPLLVHHLAHFGINIAQMEKTDKSMTELEIDINQRLGEWSTIQESGSRLAPLYGPGYTGLVNLGNSCYLNSIMQVLFSIPDFQDRYFKEADAIFESAPQDPTADFSVQMAKLAYGLLSGEYSRPPAKTSSSETDTDESQPGIKPTMFKWLIGKGHPEFSTKRQQDAQEFYLHLVNVLERNNRNRPNPADCFKFREEDRTVCTASKRVKYMHNTQFALRLPIPMEQASRDGKLGASSSCSREEGSEDSCLKQELKDTVRPHVSLSKCLEAYACEKVVPDFYSTAICQKTTALRSPRMATFPDYLVIHLEKFTFENGWIPKKLDVSVEVPDELDLSFLKGCGLQPGEEELPEENAPIPTHLAAPVSINKEVVSQLAEMGFPFEACRKAVYNTGNQGVEAASGWIMEHMGDPDFAEPLAGLEAASSESFEPDGDALQTIMGMGFSHEQAVKALKATDNNIERAVDWIFSHVDELTTGANMEVDQASDSHSTFRDGPAKYRLMAFVSHMGTSTMVGHYVCHIFKDGRWAIYNDNKVAVSENPPKDLGYLYFYKRISD